MPDDQMFDHWRSVQRVILGVDGSGGDMVAVRCDTDGHLEIVHTPRSMQQRIDDEILRAIRARPLSEVLRGIDDPDLTIDYRYHGVAPYLDRWEQLQLRIWADHQRLLAELDKTIQHWSGFIGVDSYLWLITCSNWALPDYTFPVPPQFPRTPTPGRRDYFTDYFTPTSTPYTLADMPPRWDARRQLAKPHVSQPVDLPLMPPILPPCPHCRYRIGHGPACTLKLPIDLPADLL